MSKVLNSVSDLGIRKMLKHAEQQGFVLSVGGHGVVVRTPPSKEHPKGQYVETVSTSVGGDWRNERNALAALRRMGYDENWVKPKGDTSAYKVEIPADQLFDRAAIEASKPEMQPEAWEFGPFILRTLSFLEAHPNAWWSFETIAVRVGWSASSVATNSTHIVRRDPHVKRRWPLLMWDNEGFGKYRTRLERREDARRASGEVEVPLIKWKDFDELGRLVGEDDDGQVWYAVPKGTFD